MVVLIPLSWCEVAEDLVGEANGDVDDAHVGEEEGLQGVDPLRRVAVEGVAHGARVRVAPVLQAAEAVRVLAAVRTRRLVDLETPQKNTFPILMICFLLYYIYFLDVISYFQI